MAAIPAQAASSFASKALAFVATAAANYLLGRLTAQDGPRLDNLAAAGGDYGVPMARGYGSLVRTTGAFIAMAAIKETKHTVEDYSEIAGAIGGAAAGAVYGPVGAAVGAVVGGALGFLTPNQKYYTYSDTFAVFLLDRTNDDPITNVTRGWAAGKKIFSGSETVLSSTFDGDGKLIKRKYGKNKYFKSLTVYAGNSAQTVDPILASKVGEDGAYPFSAYIVVEDLQLAAFGQAAPATEWLVNIKDSESMAEAAENIAAAANINPTRDISTTALADKLLGGYLISSESSCWDALKPLLPVFRVDAADIGGQIRWYERSQTIRATFTPDDMGAYIYGDSPPSRFNFSRGGDLDLPKSVSLTFIDPARDYQPNTMTSSRSEGSAASNITTSVTVTMSATEGATTAAVIHWDSWLGRTALGFTLTDSWASLAVGLAYGIPFADQVIPYRITRRTRGANGIIEVEALSDESVTYSAVVDGTSGTPPDDESTEFADTRLILMDMPLLVDDHDDYGYYVVMGDAAPGWVRGAIQVSGDGGATYVTIIDQPVSAVMGDVTGTLAAGTTTGLDDTLDTTSVLTVVLLHDEMELESATDAQLDANANFAYVGKDGLGEYIQFKTATFISGTTWELTNLRRGRHGTDHAIATHTSGEEFAVLTNGEGVFHIIYTDTSQWGNPFKFRGVTFHQDEADAAVVDFTNTGEGKRPFSPVNVEGSWDGSNNLTATFESRSRLWADGLGIDDNFEFDVEITNATPVRAFTVSAETFNYSAADAVSDGLVAGQVVEGRVRQTSDVNDGRWREFTLYGPLARTADSTLIFADSTLLTADSG